MTPFLWRNSHETIISITPRVWRIETHQGRYYSETSGLELALGPSCVSAYLHRILPEGVQENYRKLGLVTSRSKCESWGVLSTSASHYCVTFWVQVSAAALWHSEYKCQSPLCNILSTSASRHSVTFWVQVPAATLWHSEYKCQSPLCDILVGLFEIVDTLNLFAVN